MSAMMPPDNPMAGVAVAASPYAAVEAFYDPESIRLLYARGIDEGWRCLEVGGGGGSIARWLLSRCGDYGRIVVTDIDTSHMQDLQDPKVEVDHHDIVRDPVPDNVFHLVHERLVLGELTERDTALEKMVRTVRGGGMIVVEELDRATLAPAAGDSSAVALFEKVVDTLRETLRAKGLDPDYGRRVYARLLELGMIQGMARGSTVIQAGGTLGAGALRYDVSSRREDLLASGLVSEADLNLFDLLLRDAAFGFSFVSATMYTTWAWKQPPF
jgi:hypothetical protein